MTIDNDQLVRAVDLLVDQVGHWNTARWAQRTTTGRTRAEVVHALAQRLADLEAQLTGRPARPVPRLDNDLALPDQVRVLALDLVLVEPGPVVRQAALDAVAEARDQL